MAGLCIITKEKRKVTLWPLFVDGVQLSQGYRATTRRQFIFHYSGLPGTHLIDLGKMKDWVLLETTQCFKQGAPGLGL